MLLCEDLVYQGSKVPAYYSGSVSEFWKHYPYQCFAPNDISIINAQYYAIYKLGIKYWPPYLLPFIIWGSFLLLVVISRYTCLGYQHWTNWLVFMFAVNGSLWFWIIYFFFYELTCTCQSHDHGGWPRFFGYQDTGYYVSLFYFFLIAIIVLILIVITIYDMVTMEERKMIRKWVSPEDASAYFMALKDSAPRQRVLVEVFHDEDHRPRYGRIEGRQDRMRARHFEGTIDMGEVVKEKVVTFTEDRDFDYDTWEDPTNYPDIKALLEQHLFVAFDINVTVEPGDTTTQGILDSFNGRLVASCAYRDQRVSKQLEGIVPAMKFAEMVVMRVESISQAEYPMLSCCNAFWFSSCGLWLACLLSVGAIVRVMLRKKIHNVSLNIKKKYFADPANMRSYDFEASLPGGGAAMYDGAAGTSLLPEHKNSMNPSPIPSAPMPSYDTKDQYQDTERKPEYWEEKPPPSYEDAIL